ncbi:phytoene desaturase family protein [Chloroflexota bacterium]
MSTDYDIIVIGGGPNGLATAAYLAKAGQKVLVIEKTYEMGGGLATEQPAMGGFYFNTHSIYHLMTDYAPPYTDFAPEFERRVKYVFPQPAVAAPFPDGRWLCLYKDLDKACESIAQFSKKDADTYREIRPKYEEYMKEFLAPATYLPAQASLLQAAKLEATPLGREIGEFTSKSPKKQIEDLFESDQVRALMLFLACHWGLEPEVDGIGYLVPLMLDRHVNHGLCLGGSHMVAGSLNRVIIDNGGLQLTSTLIKRIIIENGEARGVELEDGRVYNAKVVASSIDPFQTFFDYVGKEHLEADFIEKIEYFKPEAWSLFTMHLSLWDAPSFTAAAQNPDISNAFMYVMGLETEQDTLNHFKDAMSGKLPAKPICYGCFPTVHDRLQAPNRPGRHTATISSEAPYKLNGDADNWWDKKLKMDRVYELLKLFEKHAPNMNKDNVMWEYICSPLDIENKFNDMFQGSYKQGGYKPLQMGFLRPNELCSQGKTPIKNLYLCGASTHSGGMVLFGPAYNAANYIADDLGIEKWWKEPEYIAEARKKYG